MTASRQPKREQQYWLLPFRFGRLQGDRNRYVATNIAGQHAILDRDDLSALITKKLDQSSDLFRTLKSRHFLMDSSSTAAINLLAAKYRTRQAHLPQLTGLHIFVVTLRCTNNCIYCQVSNRTSDDSGFDMTTETADRALDFMFESPSEYLKVEFQGGEPLLNFDLVQHITAQARNRGREQGRCVETVICTNLSLLNDEIIEFCREHDVYISTSLDGPGWIHDRNRPSCTGADFEATSAAIARARAELGVERVSALMTTTRASLSAPHEIIDEYLSKGFTSIFLRPINPYGFAAKQEEALSYTSEEWLSFYRAAFEYILSLNRNGAFFKEDYASILLKRILTHGNHGFVDLQSPTGAFSAVAVYNYDGGIYPSDEARMLAEMGDDTFRLGELGQVSYAEVIKSDAVLSLLGDTMTEGMPMCSECQFQPFCGSDPVRHHRTQGDIVGHKALSEFCQKQQSVISLLLRTLDSSENDRNILASWVR